MRIGYFKANGIRIFNFACQPLKIRSVKYEVDYEMNQYSNLTSKNKKEEK